MDTKSSLHCCLYIVLSNQLDISFKYHGTEHNRHTYISQTEINHMNWLYMNYIISEPYPE